MRDGPVGRVRSVVLRVTDMDTSCAFYGEALGFPLQFRDGDRWAQFTAGDLTIALASPAESSGQIGLSMNVSELDSAVRDIVAAGGQPRAPITTGTHERRASVTDPSGHLLYLYSPITPAPTTPA